MLTPVKKFIYSDVKVGFVYISRVSKLTFSDSILMRLGPKSQQSLLLTIIISLKYLTVLK